MIDVSSTNLRPDDVERILEDTAGRFLHLWQKWRPCRTDHNNGVACSMPVLGPHWMTGMVNNESLHEVPAGPTICPHTNVACVAEHSPAECNRFWDCLQERIRANAPHAPSRPMGLHSMAPPEADAA